MRVHIYLSLAGAICLTAANPVPAVSDVGESPISLFKRAPTACIPAQLYPEKEELDWDCKPCIPCLFRFFGNPLGWEITNGQLADIEADGMEGVLKYDENDNLLNDQNLKRGLVGLPNVVVKIMGRPALLQFIRTFRSSPVTYKARSTYKLCFGDYSFQGPAYDSGPKLSVKHPNVNAFMPGADKLCVLKGSELTPAQRAVAQSRFFRFLPPLPSHFPQ